MPGPTTIATIGNIGSGPVGLQDTFSGHPPLVTVTITPVAQRANLNAFAWAYTATRNGISVTPTSQTWSFVGSGSLNDAALAAPTFTPTVPGDVVRSLTVVIDGISYTASQSTVEVGNGTGVVITIAAVANRADLTAFAFGYTVTKGGIAVTPVSQAWLAIGDAAGSFDDNTLAAPTYTPTVPGLLYRTVSVVIGGVTYRSAQDIVSIGDGAGIVATVATVADHSHLASDSLVVTVTKGGITITPTAVAWLVNGAATGIVDATLASTTFSSVNSGEYIATVTVTVAVGQFGYGTTSWTLGTEGWMKLTDVDLTAGALQDLSGVASGTPITIDGVSLTFVKSGTISAVSIGGGTGFKVSLNGSGAYVALRKTFAALISGYAVTDDVMILHRRVTGKTANTNHVDRSGWYGTRELGCEAKHTEGSRTASNFGGWAFGTASGLEPTIIGCRRNGRDVVCLSSTEVSGWPAYSALTKVGYIGLLQDANDAAALAVGDTVDLFITQGIVATARTLAEVTGLSVWIKR